MEQQHWKCEIKEYSSNLTHLLYNVIHSFFYKNIFYKIIEAEMCEILKIF